MKLAGVIVVLVAMAGLISVQPTAAQVSDILTYRYDNARSGVDLKEAILNKSNVKTGVFGKLVFRNVDGNIYAQPLIVFHAGIVDHPNPINVVIVATEHNSVYAFDADDVVPDDTKKPFEMTKKALWHRGPDATSDRSPGLGPPIISDGTIFKEHEGDMMCGGLTFNGKCVSFCPDLTTEIGITSTPVIKLTKDTSPKQGVIFVVAKSFSGGHATYTLFALNLANGRPIGTGVPIQGTVAGPSGTITFDPLIQLNRPALLLDNNILYVAFGSHCDRVNYRGWVFAFDVSDAGKPARLSMLSTTFTNRTDDMNDRNGRGGIWMSGYGLATDGNAIFLSTGDGTYNVTNMSFPELSDSVIKVKLVSGKLEIQDWFSPMNRDELMKFDADLGSAGPVLVPDSHLLIAGGKEGRMYLIDRNDMGHGSKFSVQSFQVTPPPLRKVDHPQLPQDMLYWNIHGAPVIWPVEGRKFVYVIGEEDHLKQYTLVPDPGPAGWRFENPTTPQVSMPTVGLPRGRSSIPPEYTNLENRQRDATDINMPGGFVALSANGTDPNSGIVWATIPFCDNANQNVVWGVLRAFDASDISKQELWDSEFGSADCNGGGKDSLGYFAKYNPPIVANGKVYVAAFQQEAKPEGMHTKSGLLPALVIYGLKQNP